MYLKRCINKQLEEYFQALLSKYQCGFRKGYSVINVLLPMIEKWRKSLDAGGAFGALLTDLSKAFYCLPHELLIAKLHAYGVDIPSLKLLHSYLTKRKTRSEIEWHVQFVVWNSLRSSARGHTWTIVIQHISMRPIPVFPWCRYCKVHRRQHSPLI